MSTSHAPSASPTSSTFIHVPTTPKESVVKPNPHPYAIRTTSTGILTRSNSSGHNVAASRHHYVPLSPATRETRKRHRYTKSLTHEPMCELGAPRPLPVPETFTGNGGSNRSGWTGSIRHNRFVQDSVFLSAATSEDLPSNPKLWTTSQLATYLATALRVPTDDSTAASLPTQNAGEIIAFTKEANINGRIFLRLIEDDLDKYGISPLWRDALLAASRNLRQNVIKGRIWGGDSDGLESSSCSLPSHPFSSALYNSSSSSVDLADDVRESYRKTRRNRGRVHGMVQSFERSGSFSSESSLERDESQERYHHGRWLKDNITSEGAVLMSPVSDSSSLPSSSPPLPAMQEPAVEEPTVEALLAESEPSGTWGARAWEELDAAPGVTVKRVEEPAAMASNINADTVSRLQSMAAFSGAGTAKSIRLSKGKQDRRVITAIFTPPVNETAGCPDPGSVVEPGTSNQADNVHVMRPILSPADTIEERVAATQRELDLEAELAETRALVHAFRARLEEVERKVADLEVEVSRSKAAREKLVSVVTTTQAAQDRVDMLPDVEPDSSASFDSDLSSSTLVDADEELMEIRSMHFSPPPQVMLTPEKKSAEEPCTADAHDDHEPASVAEIPHYVLLVGLGVCAVVLRVILKRAGGRGWRL